MPQVRFAKINENAKVPQYHTPGSVGFDFETIEETIIFPKEIQLLPTGLVIEVPPDYMLMVALRSSTPRKWGLTMPQGVGIVDQDYCGPEDEIKIQVCNIAYDFVRIPKGVRLAQGVFIPVGVVPDVAWVEYLPDALGNSRGGFGSTGE